MHNFLFPPRSKTNSPLHFSRHLLRVVFLLFILTATGYTVIRDRTHLGEKGELAREIQSLTTETEKLKMEMQVLTATESALRTEVETLKNEDLRKTNIELKQKIAEVETTFRLASQTLENVSDARYQGVNVASLEKDLAQSVNFLSQLKYSEANTKLSEINKKVTEMVAAKQAQLATAAIPAQEPPVAGSYRRQSVNTPRGTFTISLIAEQTSSVRMITDTANDDTCTSNCPVQPLATFVSRNGGFAGINGSYFCPPDYPSCADKVNSYNTLVFNSRIKKYMNSDQNVYSTNAMVVQNSDRSMRFLSQALEWGRDTGIIGGLSNYPMLVSGGQARVTDSGAKGPRGFIGVKSGTFYFGIVHAADLGDAAAVLVTLGLDTAMNLDGGGSSALYYNGKYVVGPGRNLPNAIILTR